MRGDITTLDNVERVPAPHPLVFEQRHLRSGRPVILTGLFDQAPIRRLADLATARRHLAGMPLRVTPNNWGPFLRGHDGVAARQASFAGFVDELSAGRGNPDEYCIEYSTPDELSAYLPMPAYLQLGDPADTWESYVFLAGAGNTTHLHYDYDLRHVLMYQVFGRKRYVVIDPQETRKLAPGSRAHVRRTSALFLEHMSDADLLAFLRYANAWDCILEPGEALLIPATCWHYVEYVDLALSVNFCLPRNRYLMALAEVLPESNVEMLALASRFRDETTAGPAELAAFEALQAADEAWYPGEEARIAALDALCVDLCAQLGLPVAGEPYHVADIERRSRVTRRALEVSAAHR